MILYDLKCDNGHRFEGWFRDGSAFEEQRTQKLINCPVCNSVDNVVAPSSIAVISRKNKADKVQNKEISPMKALQILNEYMDNNFDDVGDKFADIAIRMHYGEEKARNIRGTSTKDEEDILMEEGINFIKIPVPKSDS